MKVDERIPFGKEIGIVVLVTDSQKTINRKQEKCCLFLLDTLVFQISVVTSKHRVAVKLSFCVSLSRVCVHICTCSSCFSSVPFVCKLLLLE
ncbi:hypothetical protein NC652_000018 [Populus alba x Populus x berolinensis]|uniref:Uncharacterized protein n=1 Tax=Populus alba x Populus x berolinensis TaxID=444605 RepID=A0AAD6WHI1_9ROSI|nr:hypothetical protein NC652_000018 [Populus alba x Populus x berolinensis]KAJ7012006.1 hypothetical protein NC653_002177 [Populus alba x Populus x berolinensis]KAJ7012012.1 hypothetical protein NC653_002183 [Populus alba x Populus x berolinensis]